MEARTFFDFGGIVPDFLILQNIERDSKKIQYYWESRSSEAMCPFCGARSNKECKDYFEKPLQDMPQDGLTVYHVVRSKRYFCENPGCPHTRFVERLDGFAEETARKTISFKKYCVERALDNGCKPAEDALKREGALVSNDSIARYLKVESAKQIESNIKRNDVRVLAIDDINLRKGDKSTGCTVLIDEETHRVLLIIRGTTKEAAKKAIEMFPSAEFLSRDRASSYASAATECGKIQIADRFHLIKNAHAAVEEALMTSIPATIFVREGDGWVQATQCEDIIPVRPYFYVLEEDVEERIRLAGLTEFKAKRYRNTLKILELADQGVKTADIANTLNIPLKDVRLLRRTAVSTLDYVEEKIKSRINSANE
ncbi:MAG: transposase, partial [Paludibacteraceae bacterium]